VFAVDLAQMGWNTIERADALKNFLRRSPRARLDIIVHDTRYLEGRCARLQMLYQRYGYAMALARTGPEAKAAREAFITAASIGVIPVVKLDGQAIGDGKPGPIEARLRAAYWADRA
jgi:D-alanine transaminase